MLILILCVCIINISYIHALDLRKYNMGDPNAVLTPFDESKMDEIELIGEMALKGHSVGDAMGAPVEFADKSWVEYENGNDRLNDAFELKGGNNFGSEYVNPGETTDDTAMAVAMYNALLQVEMSDTTNEVRVSDIQRQLINNYQIWGFGSEKPELNDNEKLESSDEIYNSTNFNDIIKKFDINKNKYWDIGYTIADILRRVTFKKLIENDGLKDDKNENMNLLNAMVKVAMNASKSKSEISMQSHGTPTLSNGVLMRAVPLSLYAIKLKSFAEIEDLVRADVYLTNANDHCVMFVSCYVIALRHLIVTPLSDSITQEDRVIGSIQQVIDYWSYIKESPKKHGNIKYWYQNKENTKTIANVMFSWLINCNNIKNKHTIEDVNLNDENDGLLPNAFGKLESKNKACSRAANMGMLPIAWTRVFWHLFHFESFNFDTSIREVVSEGGDTDTNACIVAAMMGALHYKELKDDFNNKKYHALDDIDAKKVKHNIKNGKYLGKEYYSHDNVHLLMSRAPLVIKDDSENINQIIIIDPRLNIQSSPAHNILPMSVAMLLLISLFVISISHFIFIK